MQMRCRIGLKPGWRFCLLLAARAVQMLRSEDPGVHYEAVGVIGNLVHSSQDIKQRVLEVGGWQGSL